jgi:hypothetical protein
VIQRPTSAWGQAAPSSIELLATLPEGSYGSPAPDPADVRYELVDRNYAPTPYAPDALLRTIRKAADEHYDVRVVAADGRLRMSGSYSDPSLQVPHGLFEYYFMDGQLESRGAYTQGNKAGVWERYAFNGRRLADRVYTGLSVEEMVRAATGEEELAGRR